MRYDEKTVPIHPAINDVFSRSWITTAVIGAWSLLTCALTKNLALVMYQPYCDNKVVLWVIVSLCLPRYICTLMTYYHVTRSSISYVVLCLLAVQMSSTLCVVRYF